MEGKISWKRQLVFPKSFKKLAKQWSDPAGRLITAGQSRRVITGTQSLTRRGERLSGSGRREGVREVSWFQIWVWIRIHGKYFGSGSGKMIRNPNTALCIPGGGEGWSCGVGAESSRWPWSRCDPSPPLRRSGHSGSSYNRSNRTLISWLSLPYAWHCNLKSMLTRFMGSIKNENIFFLNKLKLFGLNCLDIPFSYNHLILFQAAISQAVLCPGQPWVKLNDFLDIS